jgi:hypothetical protein
MKSKLEDYKRKLQWANGKLFAAPDQLPTWVAGKTVRIFLLGLVFLILSFVCFYYSQMSIKRLLLLFLGIVVLLQSLSFFYANYAITKNNRTRIE